LFLSCSRATNFYITLYWADFLEKVDPSYGPLFNALTAARPQIVEEFKVCQGEPVDLGGYFLFDADKTRGAMNPSPTLNKILSTIGPDLLP
jgi:isocitrate dehydrogenase